MREGWLSRRKGAMSEAGPAKWFEALCGEISQSWSIICVELGAGYPPKWQVVPRLSCAVVARPRVALGAAGQQAA